MDHVHVQAMTDTNASTTATAAEFNRCLVRYARLATKPRTPDAWAALTCRMWEARSEALKAGVLVKHRPDGSLSDNYLFFSDRMRDAEQRTQAGRTYEAKGWHSLV